MSCLRLRADACGRRSVKSVGYSPVGEVSIVDADVAELADAVPLADDALSAMRAVSEANWCGMWPVVVSLELELSLPWVPHYVALDTLFQHRDTAVREAFTSLAPFDTSLDDVVLPLVTFVQQRSSRVGLSARQMKLGILRHSLMLLETIAEALVTGDTSRHHTLLRPIKELIAVPGDLCAIKREHLTRLRSQFFPGAPPLPTTDEKHHNACSGADG